MAIKMTREQVDNSDELNLATGCIVSDMFLEELYPILKKNIHLIKANGVKTIVQWCLAFYEENNTSPKAIISDIYTSKQVHLPEETSESIQTILSNLNERYVKEESTYSENYYANKAKTYLEKESLLRLAQEITGAVSSGNTDDAKRILTSYNKVDKILSTGIDPFSDKTIISKMFDALSHGIIQFPYPVLEELFRQIYRKDVVSVAGKAKAGKSFMMQQFGIFGLYSGLNVAVFSFEMGVEIMGMRLFQNLMGESRNEMEKPTKVPYFDDNNNICFYDMKKDGLKIEEVLEAQKDFRGMFSDRLRLFDSDHCGRRVSDIVDALNRLEKYENFKADMVVIDYDSLLENEPGFAGSTYDGINVIWKDVKNKIALDLDTVVIFGSQLNKEGAKGDGSPLNASHSSRKFDWVSVWCSLMASEEERKSGLARISALGRHHDFSGDDVVITQALGLARPILDARWKKHIPNYEESFQKDEDEEEVEYVKEVKREAQESWNF